MVTVELVRLVMVVTVEMVVVWDGIEVEVEGVVVVVGEGRQGEDDSEMSFPMLMLQAV